MTGVFERSFKENDGTLGILNFTGDKNGYKKIKIYEIHSATLKVIHLAAKKKKSNAHLYLLII